MPTGLIRQDQVSREMVKSDPLKFDGEFSWKTIWEGTAEPYIVVQRFVGSGCRRKSKGWRRHIRNRKRDRHGAN